MAFDAARNLLAQATQNGDIPSAVLAVGRGREVFLKEAWGKAVSVGGDVPANLDTRYDMASLTKIFSTTSLAFKLIDRGDLCLADELGMFFPDAPEDKAGITIQELMTHSSGIPSHIMLRDKTDGPAQAAQVILSTPLDAPRGERVMYSCMGFILLGFIIEKLTGMGLDKAAKTMIFEPLSMHNTGYLPQSTNIAATEYDERLGRCKRGEVHDENAYFLGGVSGNAGVFSDIHDCVRFASMLSCGGATAQGAFFSPALMRQAMVDYTPGKEEDRGLGFKLRGPGADYSGDLFTYGSIGHTGFTGTSMIVDKATGLFVVLLTNRVHPTRENEAVMRLRHQVHNAVMAEFSCV